MSSCESIVGAYALTTVAMRLLSSFTLTVIRRSLMPCGSSVSWPTRLFLMAKPTPCILGSPAGFPFQKKVYPPFSSLSCPSSASLVSDRAAMSMLNLRNSLATKAVLLSGLSQESLARRAHSTLRHSFFFVSDRIEGDPTGRGNPAGKLVRQTIFGTPFLVPSPTGVSSVDPEKGCSVVGEGTEGFSCLNPRIQRLKLHPPPVCRFVTGSFQTSRSCSRRHLLNATGLKGNVDFPTGGRLCVTSFNVGRLVHSQPPHDP